MSKLDMQHIRGRSIFYFITVDLLQDSAGIVSVPAWAGCRSEGLGASNDLLELNASEIMDSRNIGKSFSIFAWLAGDRLNEHALSLFCFDLSCAIFEPFVYKPLYSRVIST